MTETTDAVIAAIEADVGLKPGALSDAALAPYAGFDLAAPPAEVAVVRAVLSPILRRMLTAPQDAPISASRAAPALLQAREVLLSMPDEALSPQIKQFIRDHCPC